MKHTSGDEFLIRSDGTVGTTCLEDIASLEFRTNNNVLRLRSQPGVVALDDERLLVDDLKTPLKRFLLEPLGRFLCPKSKVWGKDDIVSVK
mmetsp:Transcript_12820/g.23107  ORF Transcript_12820/g.23107 Transcript_12820/m.23107 type:complete len:91 (+) Transcript_12820:137-409(+)